MLNNFFTKAALLAAGAQLVAAHSEYQNFVINGEQQPHRFAVQRTSNEATPIRDVTSDAMICKGGEPVDGQVDVLPGDSIGMQWFRFDNETTTERNFPIAGGHLGPVLIYIAEASTNGVGAVWHKIFEDGLSADGSWAVDRFRANNGLMTIELPDLVPGDYLIRPEIIALHQAKDLGRAQLFLGCGQMKVGGNGSLALPAEGTDMTTAYSPTDPGILVDIEGLTKYIIPGPALLEGVDAEVTVAVEEETEEAVEEETEETEEVVEEETDEVVKKKTEEVVEEETEEVVEEETEEVVEEETEEVVEEETEEVVEEETEEVVEEVVEEETDEVVEEETEEVFTFTFKKLIRLLKQALREAQTANTRRHARGFRSY